MRASLFALSLAAVAILGAGTAEARGRRSAPPERSRAAATAPANPGIAPWGSNAGRPLTSRDGGTIHWNTGNEWGNLGGPGGGGGSMGGQ